MPTHKMDLPKVSFTVTSQHLLQRHSLAQEMASLDLKKPATTLTWIYKNPDKLYYPIAYHFMRLAEVFFESQQEAKPNYKKALETLQNSMPSYIEGMIYLPNPSANKPTPKKGDLYIMRSRSDRATHTIPIGEAKISCETLPHNNVFLWLEEKNLKHKKKTEKDDIVNFAKAICSCAITYTQVKITIDPTLSYCKELIDYLTCDLSAYQQMHHTLSTNITLSQPTFSFRIALKGTAESFECTEKQTNETIEQITKDDRGLNTFFKPQQADSTLGTNSPSSSGVLSRSSSF